MTLTDDDILLPVDAWNSFGAGHQLADCTSRTTDTSIDCECLLKGDSKFLKRKSGDWKPDHRTIVRLPYRLRQGRLLLIDSSGAATLSDVHLFM